MARELKYNESVPQTLSKIGQEETKEGRSEEENIQEQMEQGKQG